MRLTAGSSFGNYVVERRLGEGGLAAVYCARHRVLGSLHALKVLRDPSRDTQERLLQEGKAQSSLRHPNIAAVTDVVQVPAGGALVLEYVDGPSLADVLDSDVGLAETQVDALAQGILEGVAAAHASQLVHRDLKPGNVLLAVGHGDVVPKVADFGLVKWSDNEHLSTQSGVMMGTPAYMAPEQVSDAKAVDARADVFSLGALLYHLLTGDRPFRGHNLLSVLDRMRAGEFDPLTTGGPSGVPAPWADAIHRSLAPDPNLRPANASALLALWRRHAPERSETLWPSETLATLGALKPGEHSAGVQDELLDLDTMDPMGAGGTPQAAFDPTTPHVAGLAHVATAAGPIDVVVPDTISAAPIADAEALSPRATRRAWIPIALLVLAVGIGAGVWRWATTRGSGTAGPAATTEAMPPNTPSVKERLAADGVQLACPAFEVKGHDGLTGGLGAAGCSSYRPTF